MPLLADAAPAPVDVDPFVEAYEAARRQRGRALVADHLPPTAHPGYVRVLAELVRVDLEYAWADGRPRPLGDYLAAFPDLLRCPTVFAEVAYEEFRQRWEHGQEPNADDYHERYGIDTSAWIAVEAVADERNVEATRVVEHVPPPLLDQTPPPRGLLDAASVGLTDDAAEAARAFRFDPAGGSVGYSAPARLMPPEAARVFASLRVSSPFAAARFADAVTALPEVGSVFAGFEILAELGRGGFGRVYLARQEDLAARLVALKVAADLTGEPQTLAQLQHTNIVPIYSFHRVGTLQAVCMPYFGSVTLADVIGGLGSSRTIPGTGHHFVSTLNNRKHSTSARPESRTADAAALPLEAPAAAPDRPSATHEYLTKLTKYSYVEAVLWLGARLADGLAHAHDRGVIHRDLKPANILLTDEGQPMLLDFNLAADSHAPTPASAARVGGTLPYMAPEHLSAFQGLKATVDARSDVYSLGLILFELLAGKHPFPTPVGPLSRVVPEMLAGRQLGPPTLGRINPAVSPATEAIVRKCLDPNPGLRYPSARALQEDLEHQLASRPLQHAAEPSVRERVRKWARRNRRLVSTGPFLTAAVVLILALGVSVWRHKNTAFERQAVELWEVFRKEKMEHELALSAGLGDAAARDATLDAGYATLARYGVLTDPEWDAKPAVARLPEADRQNLRREAGELLFRMARPTARRGGRGTTPDRDRLVEAARLSARAVACYSPDELPFPIRDQAEELARLAAGGPATAVDRTRPVPEPRTAREALLAAVDLEIQGRVREALPLAQRAVDAEPGSYIAQFVLGQCYLELRDCTKAEVAFGACIALAPAFHWGTYKRGQCRFLQENYSGARADYDATLRLQPGFAAGYIDRGIVMESVGNLSAALADYTRALDHGTRVTQVYFLRAAVNAKQGNETGSRADLRVGLALIPSDEQSWIERGLVRLETDPSPDAASAAIADFDRALEMNPASQRAIHNKACVLSEKLWRTEEAVRVLEDAVRRFPEFHRARSYRGILYARLGDRAKAIEDATACVRDGSGNLRRDVRPDLIYRAGMIYAQLSRSNSGDRKETLNLLKVALARGYKVERAGVERDYEPVKADPAFREIVAELSVKSATARRVSGVGE